MLWAVPCAVANVLAQPDKARAAHRKSLLTLTLLGAIVALLAFALLQPGQFAAAPRPSFEAEQTAPDFPGASEKRVFLSEADGAAVAKRGLVPVGTRSIIATGGQLSYGEWRWDDAGVPAGPTSVRVDLDRQLVSVFRGAHEIGTAVVVYGIDGKETPRGRLPILGKTRDYHSRTYDAPMPYSLWLRNDGVAIHGSSVSMGKATNGCIGVPVEFAAKLFDVAKKGDVIEVVG